MTKNDIIISLVRLGFNFTFEYQNEQRFILFIKTGFRSSPILMDELEESTVDKVKKESLNI